MAKHTEYWQRYARAQGFGALRILGLLLIALVCVVTTTYFQAALGEVFPFLIGALFLALVVAIVWMVRHAYRVVCPECGTVYRRHKWGGQCPSCGLRLLQESL